MSTNIKRYRQIEKKTGLSFLCVGLFGLLYVLILPLYRISDFLIVSLLSLIIFFLVDKIAPKKIMQIEITDEPLLTGIVSADEALKVGNMFIDELLTGKKQIQEARIKEKIGILVDLFTKILDQIKNDPSDARKIKQFMNYYLPTISKLINHYIVFEKQNIDGANIVSSMQKIEELFDTAIIAFKKTLDSMFADEALDIATDITGMQNMMASRGLNEDIITFNIKEKV
ncbi:MAG: 5-bromo-4-chloroindolyl phosphate hydrolysis family protein [Erysipelotrichaceae bacterium]|nr:5-bromo-4-chloroindolyl phosphate hydrolysis family protein [Erysipelotrichaceae bacterium]